MRRVLKYIVPFQSAARHGSPPLVPIPEGGQIVAVGMDPETGDPAVWVDLHDDRPMVERFLLAFATVAEVPEQGRFLGTAMCGIYRWHVFEFPL